MSTLQDVISYANIRLYWPYEAQSLREIRIVRKVHDHARLYVSGILPEEQGARCLLGEVHLEPIAIRQIDEQGRSVRRLFHGLLTQLTVHRVQDVYTFELEAISHTWQMDLKPRRRSFQDVNLTYSDLLDQVMSAYANADVIDTASCRDKLGAFTLQYEETDWGFLQRMSSRFGTILVPEVTAASPKLFFGLPEGRLWKLEEETTYRLKKTLGGVRLFKEEGYVKRDSRGDSNLWCGEETESGYISYIFESNRHYALGDSIQLQNGLELKVAAAETRMEDGLLMTTYQLVPEEQLKQQQRENNQAIGATLRGKVIRVEQDAVQMHLIIDSDQVDADRMCWFPVATGYVAEGQSGIYSMPETGDTAQLYLPTAHEGHAIVRGFLRQKASTLDPGEKSWSNPGGKEIRLSRQELKLSAGSGLFISLNAGGAISIHSSGDLAISGGNLHVEAGQNLSMQAQQAIYLRGGSSSMVLDGETDLRSPLIKQTGSVKAPVVVVDLPPVPESPLMTIEAYEAARAVNSGTNSGIVNVSLPTAIVSSGKGEGLLKAAMSLLGMMPVIGAVVKAISEVAHHLLGGVPSLGPMKASSANFMVGFEALLKRQQDAEQRYASRMWGKVWTSAREIKGSGSLQDLLRNIRSNFNELQAEYRAIPPSIRDKWRQKAEEQNTRPIDHGLNPSEDWENQPAKKDFIDKYLVDPITTWITGEDPRVKTQRQQVMEAELMTMSLQIQMTAQEAANDLTIGLRGVASANRVNKVLGMGSSSKNTSAGKQTTGSTAKIPTAEVDLDVTLGSRSASKPKGTGEVPKIKSAKEVEIVNQRGESLGEFDEIDLVKKIFYEDKSAQGLDRVNPKTGLPAQTPQQFADKQILTKTRNRINELQNATSTRATKNGSTEIPDLDSIKNIREFVFRLDGNTPELKQAVENSLNQLRKEFPDYKFSAVFGGE